MTENHFDDDDLFNSRKDYKNQYSTFIEELQQSTEKLMNQVFNSEYVPEINQQQLNSIDSSKINKHTLSKFSSMAASRKHNQQFKNSKRTTATKCQSQKDLSESFVNFLTRNQKWKQRRLNRAKNEHNKKQQQQMKGLTFIPTILKSSKQKVDQPPIYERCLDIQKQRQKKLAFKRMNQQKQKNQRQQIEHTFKPEIITKAKNRTLEQYLRDKQQWNNKKIQYIENSKIIRDAKQYEQCLFHPILVAKYNQNPTRVMNQPVEDRLLRSLQKSIEKKEKKQQIKPNKNINKNERVKLKR